MSENENIYMYYCPSSGVTDTETLPLDQYRLKPAPNISIKLNYEYSNDTIIGYNYTLSMDGYSTIESSSGVIDNLHNLRKILSQNNNNLYIYQKDQDFQNSATYRQIMVAHNGILKSFNIDPGNNRWAAYAPYSAELQFYSIDFDSYKDNCNDGIFLDPNTYDHNSGGIIDISKYKIKEFSDSWKFIFNDNDSFSRIGKNELDLPISINNSSFEIEYSISAVGKHYSSIDTDGGAPKSLLLPAWEQAKNFVQDRLYYQVTNLISGVLISHGYSCSTTGTLSNISHPASGSSGLLNGLNNYKIYNEEITCEASESDGSFNASYKSTVVYNNTNHPIGTSATKHTITKSISKTYEGNKLVNNISIDGTIQGLIEGGLINNSGPLELPSAGNLLIYNSWDNSKYLNAEILLNKIFDSNYYGLIKKDFKPSFKTFLGITPQEVGGGSTSDVIPDPPHPNSFNLTKDFTNGTINYNLEYSSNYCNRLYQTINIDVNEPHKQIALLNLPNSLGTPLIQELGTTSPKTINITVKGFILNDSFQIPPPLTFDNIMTYIPNLPANSILKNQELSYNPLDGSYNVDLVYICGTEGCGI